MGNLLSEFLRRPTMFIGRESYEQAAFFLQGANEALNDGLLLGFQEWWCMRSGSFPSQHWSQTIYETAALSSPPGDENLAAIQLLYDTLQEYMNDRSKPHGVRRIFVRYQRWIEQQEWYSPDTDAVE